MSVATEELADLGVLQTAAAVRAGKVTAEEVAAAALERIERLDNRYNCFTRIDVEDALNTARRTDRAIRRGDEPGLLAGVPFGAKDLFDVAGETTTAGARLRSGAAPAEDDAAAVSFLKRAGGTLLGAQNMDEFAYGFTTENEHTGATCNPHDVTRIAGGSSGGSAAAVAAGLCAAAIGSDTNGSVRVPAAFCGVFGLKPTFGRISRRGVFPFVHSLDHVGGFARSVADLAALYDALQGRDVGDPAQADREVEPALPGVNAQDRKLRVGMLGGYFHESAAAEVLEAQRAVAEALGADDVVEMPEVERARSAAFVLSAAEGGSLHLDDLKRHPQHYDHAVRDRLIAGAMMPAGLVLRAQRFRRWFRDAVKPMFRAHDILVAPATPFAAQPIGQKTIRMARGELSVRANAGLYTQPISFIGLPVVVVPLTDRGRLPLGVQLIGAPWTEARLLRAARRLERDGVVKVRTPTELAA